MGTVKGIDAETKRFVFDTITITVIKVYLKDKLFG